MYKDIHYTIIFSRKKIGLDWLKYPRRRKWFNSLWSISKMDILLQQESCFQRILYDMRKFLWINIKWRNYSRNNTQCNISIKKLFTGIIHSLVPSPLESLHTRGLVRSDFSWTHLSCLSHQVKNYTRRTKSSLRRELLAWNGRNRDWNPSPSAVSFIEKVKLFRLGPSNRGWPMWEFPSLRPFSFSITLTFSLNSIFFQIPEALRSHSLL